MLLVKRWIVPNINTRSTSHDLKIALCKNKKEKGVLRKLLNVRLQSCSPAPPVSGQWSITCWPQHALRSPLRLLRFTAQSAFLWLYFTRHWEQFPSRKLATSYTPVGWALLPLFTCPRTTHVITGARSQRLLPHQSHVKGGSWPGPSQAPQKPVTAYWLGLPKTWLGLPGWEVILCRFPPATSHSYTTIIRHSHVYSSTLNNISVAAANLRLQRNLLWVSDTANWAPDIKAY